MSITTGCAGISVSPQTVVPESPRVSQATLVVGEITRPRDLTTAAPFYVAMSRDLSRELEHAHLAANIVDERDLTPKGTQGPAYALRYRVVEDNVVVTSTGTGCFLGLLLSGSFTIIPLFFIGLCTASAEHRLTIEARVFDLANAEVKSVRDSNSNEMLNVYDTSALSPLLRREYHVMVEVSVPMNKAQAIQMHTQEALDVEKEEASEAARQILGQSLHDISRTLSQPR